VERIVYSKNFFELHDESEIDIEVEFRFNDTYVCTSEGQLIVESIKVIDQIDSPHELQRYIRPELLVIEGILSYFTGLLFTIYQKKKSELQIVEDKVEFYKEVARDRLVFESIDYSEDLSILLEKLEKREFKSLIITLLDRWRKALYMEFESEVNTLHDEAILTHFHIFELLVGYYYEDFKRDAQEKTKEFLITFASETLNQRGSNLENTVNTKFNLLKEILISDEASITTKINYFLKKYEILDDQSYALVNKLVKIRNSIAHGRITYKDKFIWPLPPFFNLTNESQIITSQIAIMTARAIALHLGLNVWKEEWEVTHKRLPPSDEVLLEFIKNENAHAEVSSMGLLNGEYKNITVFSVFNFFIENQKKCSLSDLEKVLSKTLKEITINEENCGQLFLPSVIICDSEDHELSCIAKKNVELTHQNDWYEYSNIKDIVRYFEYQGITVQWLYSWIEGKGHLK
jgi:hypothetical protein